MSQISPPVRIVLVAAIVMMAAWFLMLRPKEEAVTVAPAPPVTTAQATPAAPESAAGEAKAKAERAAAQAGAGAQTESDSPTAGTPSTAAPSNSATTSPSGRIAAVAPLTPEATADLPSAVREGLERRDTIVLGVLNEEGKPWAPMADDDRFLRRELRAINTSGGGLVVETVPLERISRFDGLIKDLDVTQSPAVVVVDGNRKGVTLTGWVDRVTINQAIADAERISTERRVSDTYLRRTNETCARLNTSFTRLSDPTVRGASGTWVARLAAANRRYQRAFARIPAPRRWRSLRTQIVGALKARETRLLAAAGNSNKIRAAAAAPQDVPLGGIALERRFNDAGLTACSANRPR